eukprot:jgi/Mesen1/2260/ME000153S01487
MADPAGEPGNVMAPAEDKGEKAVGPSSFADLSETEKKLSAEVASILERCKGLQETATHYSGRLKIDGDALGQQAISLEKEIKELKKNVNNAAEKDDVSAPLAEELEEELIRARGMVYEGDIAALLPHKANGPFLGAFLGHVNVRSSRQDVRFKVKEEYNSYRDRLWKGCFPGIPVQLYQGWLLFFYTGLALRENILRINGSDIRPCSGSSVLQAFQLYIGARLVQSAVYDAAEWQIATCGLLLVVMAVGNFANTVGTLVTKSRFKSKMRKKGRQMLERMSSSSSGGGSGHGAIKKAD